MAVSLCPVMFSQALTTVWPSMDSRSVEARDMAARSSEIEQIYRNYGGMVFRRCLQLLKIEAEAMDAAQDVFVRVVRSIGQFRGQSS